MNFVNSSLPKGWSINTTQATTFAEHTTAAWRPFCLRRSSCCLATKLKWERRNALLFRAPFYNLTASRGKFEGEWEGEEEEGSKIKEVEPNKGTSKRITQKKRKKVGLHIYICLKKLQLQKNCNLWRIKIREGRREGKRRRRIEKRKISLAPTCIKPDIILLENKALWPMSKVGKPAQHAFSVGVLYSAALYRSQILPLWRSLGWRWSVAQLPSISYKSSITKSFQSLRFSLFYSSHVSCVVVASPEVQSL